MACNVQRDAVQLCAEQSAGSGCNESSGGITFDLARYSDYFLRKTPLNLRQHEKGGMPTVHGSNRSVTPLSEPKMRRRRSRALASVVVDLIQQPGSLSTTADGYSYDSTTQGHSGEFCPVVMHRPPYMDVQTVKTNLTADQAAKLEVWLWEDFIFFT